MTYLLFELLPCAVMLVVLVAAMFYEGSPSDY